MSTNGGMKFASSLPALVAHPYKLEITRHFIQIGVVGRCTISWCVTVGQSRNSKKWSSVGFKPSYQASVMDDQKSGPQAF